MNFNFGEVLTKAWQIIWKHKILWIFGILAGCGRGGGGNGGGNGGGSNTGFSEPSTQLPPQVQQFFEKVAENATTYIAIFIAILCVFWIVAMFLSTIGKIGLIRGTFQAEGGADHLIFGQLFSESMPYFWRMFGLSIVLGIPAFLVVIVFVVFIMMGAIAAAASGGVDSTGLAMLGMIPIIIGCFCLLVPVMFVLGLIFRQAERAVVLEEMQVFPSISRGWDVFKKNLGPLIVMAIILGIINLVVGFVIAIPIIAVVFPAVFTYVAGQAQNYTPLIFMGICICLYIPVAWLVNGVAIAYAESAWTLTYMEITKKPEDNMELGPLSDDSDKTMIAGANA